MYWNMNYHVLEYTGNSKLYSTGKMKMYLKMYWNVLEFHFPFCVATLNELYLSLPFIKKLDEH